MKYKLFTILYILKMNQNTIFYGSSESPFGFCSIAFSNSKVCSLIFPENEEEAQKDFRRRLNTDKLEKNEAEAIRIITAIFQYSYRPELDLHGTPFQMSIWEALQQIPAGKTSTYSEIAAAIGRPKAVRAVGTAIGANPVAYLIPCHRILRSDGGMGGYRWGLAIKKKLLEAEGVKM
jgi:AraC family transcriptional regulator, regulatory protein of adaptative response / methylated-DNA-[protein]-cysteine methyltransferase